MKTALLAACLALATACVSPPRAAVRSDYGTVRAPTDEEAQNVAGLLDELYPAVRSLLPGTQQQKVEVWVQERLKIFWLLEPSSEVVAMNFDLWDRIHLKRGSASLAEDLAHELVHLLLDKSWKALPPVLEEGLADHVGIRLHSEYAAEFRAGRLLAVVADLGGYNGRVRFAEPTPSGAECLVFHLLQSPEPMLDPREALQPAVSAIHPHSRSSSKSTLYGLGFLVVSRIVDRIGYEGLHAEAQSARRAGLPAIPAERVLELAQLDGSPESWVEAALDGLGSAELTAMVEGQAETLALLLADACSPLFPALDGATFLARMRPAFSLRRDGPEVELASIASFQTAFCLAWPRAYAETLFESFRTEP